MSHFICPVCGGPLHDDGSSCRCENGHSYDRAKSGYLNLLMSQNKKEKRHGDDKAMVLARTRFLDAGHYHILLDSLIGCARPRISSGGVLLDLGCGEGYYSGHILRALGGGGADISLLGVDISKEAVRSCTKRIPQAELAVASAFRVPVADGSCDMVLSVFAPFDPQEVRRILSPSGTFIRAYPLEKHLLGLKRLIYEQAYENKPAEKELPGLILEESHEIRGTLRLDRQEAIQDLFMMTPYFYKTGRGDQEKLLQAAQLDTELEFGISLYRRPSPASN